MKLSIQKVEKISRSAPLKALIIAVLSVFILIPGSMIQNFIQEKQIRNIENTNAGVFKTPILNKTVVGSFNLLGFNSPPLAAKNVIFVHGTK